MKLEIFVPPELEALGIAPDLKRFFDAMIYKLRINAYKGRWENVDLAKTLDLIKAEVDELREAIEEGNVVSTVLEGADIANFALIAATIALDGHDEPESLNMEIGQSADVPKVVLISKDGKSKHFFVEGLKPDRLFRGEQVQELVKQLNHLVDLP